MFSTANSEANSSAMVYVEDLVYMYIYQSGIHVHVHVYLSSQKVAGGGVASQGGLDGLDLHGDC